MVGTVLNIEQIMLNEFMIPGSVYLNNNFPKKTQIIESNQNSKHKYAVKSRILLN